MMPKKLKKIPQVIFIEIKFIIKYKYINYCFKINNIFVFYDKLINYFIDTITSFIHVFYTFLFLFIN